MELFIAPATTKLIIAKDESYRLRNLEGENALTLYFDLGEFYEFPLGTYCYFQGERYSLTSPANFKKISNTHYQYTLQMESTAGVLKSVKFKDLASGLVKFDLVATPTEFIRLLTDNLKAFDPQTQWQVGGVIQQTEKSISFNHNSCFEALQMIATAFDTEFEIAQGVIHLKKTAYNENNPLVLSYGKGNGFLPQIERSTTHKRTTRLYVQGGSRNINPSKYQSKTLLLPKNQTYNYKGVRYITSPNGLWVEPQEKTNFTHEESLDLSHIYPKATFKIERLVYTSEGFWRIYSQQAAQINWQELLIAGEQFVIAFESGMLSGREFNAEVQTHQGERVFNIIAKEEDGITMPAVSGVWVPKIGDSFSLFGMQMPQEYVQDDSTQSGASWEMLKEAVAYLYDNSHDKFRFTGTLDGIYAKENWANIGGKIKLGGYVLLKDVHFEPQGVLIRIVSIKEMLHNPQSPQIELNNQTVKAGSVATLLGKVKQQEVLIEQVEKRAADYTKRRFKDTQETKALIEKSFTNFSQSISPATVSTMQLMVGSQALQFRFVNALPSTSNPKPKEVALPINFNAKTKQLVLPSAVLCHLTLGIDTLKNNRPANEYKYWQLPVFTSGSLNDNTTPYYLYVKAYEQNQNAEFVLLENPNPMQLNGFYYFLVGILNSEYQGERGFAKMYGFTEVLPSQITTQKIASGDGSQYIELLDDCININANVVFSAQNEQAIAAIAQEKVKIGGRNLLRNSGEVVRNSIYNIKNYTITQPLQQGEIVTCTIKGSLAPTKTAFWLYNSGGFRHLTALDSLGGGIYRKTFAWNLQQTDERVVNNNELWVWAFNHNQQGESSIEWIKLERGNTATDWSPAPEDLESTTTTLQNNINNTKNALQTELNQKQPALKRTELNLTALEANKYYPVVSSNMGATQKRTFMVEMTLHSGLHAVPWATHRTQSFSLICNWTTNGSGWGTISVERVVNDFAFAWCGQSPIMNLTQATNTSQEVFYLRGGAKYWVYTDHDISVAAHAGGFTSTSNPAQSFAVMNFNQNLVPKSSKQLLDEAATNAATAVSKSDWFSKTAIAGNAIATGVLQVGNSTAANAGISGIGTTQNSVRFYAGSNFNDREQAPFRVLNDGSLYATKGKIGTTFGIEITEKGGIKINSSQTNQEKNGGVFTHIYDGMISIKNYKTAPYQMKTSTIFMSTYGLVTDSEKRQYTDANREGGFSVESFKTLRRGSAEFETPQVSYAKFDVLRKYIGYTHTFILTAQELYTDVYLPSREEIKGEDVIWTPSFELTIIADAESQKPLGIWGVLNGRLLNAQGKTYGSEYGKITLNAGNTLKLRYYDGNYYIISHMY